MGSQRVRHDYAHTHMEEERNETSQGVSEGVRVCLNTRYLLTNRLTFYNLSQPLKP